MERRENISLWEALKNNDKPIVLYGMGDGADKILNELGRRGICAAGVFASDEFCRGQSFRGFPVISYAQAKERFGDMTVLVAFGTHLPEVMERIKRIGYEQELYVPDVPVYGEELFDMDYLKKHETELGQAYSLLADEASRQAFRDIVDYKISGKPEYLYSCESSIEEAYERVLCLGRRECYVDAGAYTGDTIRELIRYTGGYEKIFAFEPDEKNYRKLKRFAESLSNIECFRAAIYSQKGELCFRQRGGRNSAAGQSGIRIPADTLDRLLTGEPITYIKYDVEGMEQEAVRGTENVIRERKPKLLVSAYHRSEDIFRIPLLLREIRPDYRVYLRHHPCLPAWDMNYYFV